MLSNLLSWNRHLEGGFSPILFALVSLLVLLDGVVRRAVKNCCCLGGVVCFVARRRACVSRSIAQSVVDGNVPAPVNPERRTRWIISPASLALRAKCVCMCDLAATARLGILQRHL